jgi:ABC-2 type transport system ATP-binding protein
LLLALAHEPDVLILDEPMAGLDPLVREELLDGVLQSVCDRPRTILFSSHTFSDVQRLADSVAIIDQGELLVHCGVDELLTSTKRVRAVLGNGALPGEAEGAIWQQVRNREWLLTVRDFSANLLEGLRSRYVLEHVEVMDLGLEDIFKDYIRGRRSIACT